MAREAYTTSPETCHFLVLDLEDFVGENLVSRAVCAASASKIDGQAARLLEARVIRDSTALRV